MGTMDEILLLILDITTIMIEQDYDCHICCIVMLFIWMTLSSLIETSLGIYWIMICDGDINFKSASLVAFGGILLCVGIFTLQYCFKIQDNEKRAMYGSPRQAQHTYTDNELAALVLVLMVMRANNNN